MIIAPVPRRHGDHTVQPLTLSGVSGRSMSPLNIRPCPPFFFFYPPLSRHSQRPLPSPPVQVSSSPPKTETIHFSSYPSLLSSLVSVFQAIIGPRSSLIWFQSRSISSEAAEPKRNPDSFEATIVCTLKRSLRSKMPWLKVRLSGQLNRGHLSTRIQ